MRIVSSLALSHAKYWKQWNETAGVTAPTGEPVTSSEFFRQTWRETAQPRRRKRSRAHALIEDRGLRTRRRRGAHCVYGRRVSRLMTKSIFVEIDFRSRLALFVCFWSREGAHEACV